MPDGGVITGPMIFAMVSTAAAAGVSAYGAVQQGKAARDQANFEARVTESNALQESYDSVVNESVAKANKTEGQYAAYEELKSLAKQRSAGRGSAIVSLAASGLDLESTSIEGILAAEESEYMDIRRQIKTASAQQSRTFNMQARGAKAQGQRALTLGRSQAGGLRVAGKNARTSANISAFGTALQGIGSVASMMPAKPNAPALDLTG